VFIKMKNSLAPIVLFVYNRPWHTEQILYALKKNGLAKESVLHIYVDGPKAGASIEQINKIREVQELVKKEQWCGEVTYHIAKENIGCRNSILAGITEIVNKYGKVIVLEDDIFTSPWFLKYMNDSLDYYEKRRSVFSISGWNLPPSKLLIPEDYEYDVFASPRIFNWGWATWKDRWEQVDWNWDFVPGFTKKNDELDAFKRGGEDLAHMLVEMHNKVTDAWDIQFVYAHFQNHAVSIIPRQSYVNNIGLDGSGTHCGATDSLTNTLVTDYKSPVFLKNLYQDKRIINAMYSLYYPKKRPLYKKVINRIARLFGGKNVFTIKKKVFC
jgi:hypothetical protein